MSSFGTNRSNRLLFFLSWMLSITLITLTLSSQLAAQEKKSASSSEKAEPQNQKQDDVIEASDENSKPFLGVKLAKSNIGSGVRIMGVTPKSPAESAGLQVDDLIQNVDDKDIEEITDLLAVLGNKKPGDAIELSVTRQTEELNFSIVLGSKDDIFSPDVAKAKSGLLVDEPKTWGFVSPDGIKITFDAYVSHKVDAPTILLCHQAGWSRGEYREIAPKLNELGFNCYAIDQRSGGSVNDVVNETNKLAVEKGKDVTFIDAEQDIIAALKDIRRSQQRWIRPGRSANGPPKVILWGSSYSAALSLRIAGEHPELVDGVLAFAPGEYFERFGKPKDWIATSAKKIKAPAFITSAKNEAENWKSIYEAIPGEDGNAKMMFVPETKGNHGSRALWEKFDDHDAYWEATTQFLSRFSDDKESNDDDSPDGSEAENEKEEK